MDKTFFSSCAFCSEFNSIKNGSNYYDMFLSRRLHSPSRVILESDNFVVIPTVGCLIEGYLLIVSKTHYCSSVAVTPDMLDELANIVNRTKALIVDNYGTNAVCFEHGSAFCANTMGGCIEHAHIHVVPYDSAITEEVSSYNLNKRQIESFRTLSEYGEKNLPYLYWQDIDGSMFVVDDGFVPSQFFRRIIARHYNIPEAWDWRQYPFINNIVKTFETLRQR